MLRIFARPILQIVVNGDVRTVPAGTTVAALLQELNLPSRYVAVERNRQLVPRATHPDCILAEGDELEIVTLVGGG